MKGEVRGCAWQMVEMQDCTARKRFADVGDACLV
jgi:hypothetical protein